jgi:hypothetical protein
MLANLNTAVLPSTGKVSIVGKGNDTDPWTRPVTLASYVMTEEQVISSQPTKTNLMDVPVRYISE